MTIQNVLAQAAVRNLNTAENWYCVLFDRLPDARPMEGLVEWHLGAGFGVQLWVEPERAGRSSIVLGESDLDRLAARLTRAGMEHSGLETLTASRALILQDPDGNRVVVTGE